MIGRKVVVAFMAGAGLVGVLALTSVGESAREALPTALFAKNADKVDGIDASRVPSPGKLLPLDSAGKFPAVVLPDSAKGEAGSQGVQGERGPSKIYARYRDALNVSGGPDQQMAELGQVDLPAGSFVVRAKAEITWTTRYVDQIRCSLIVGSESDTYRFTIGQSSSYNSSRLTGAETLVLESVATLRKPVTATFTCSGFYESSANFQGIRITAIQVAEADNAALG